MSVWVDMFAAPNSDVLLDQGTFEEFVLSCVQQGIIMPSFTLISGDFSINSPLEIASLFYAVRHEAGGAVIYTRQYAPGTILQARNGTVTVYRQGEDLRSLIEALRAFPYSKQNLCILTSLGPQVAGGADVLLCALATPQVIVYEEVSRGKPMDEQQTQNMKQSFKEAYGEEPEFGDDASFFIGLKGNTRCCFITTAKGGNSEIEGPMEEVFSRYFGDDFCVVAAYS